MKICKNCHHENPDTAYYCFTCGQVLEPASDAAAPQPQQPIHRQPLPEQRQQAQAQRQAQPAQLRQPRQRQSGQTGDWLAPIVIGVYLGMQLIATVFQNVILPTFFDFGYMRGNIGFILLTLIFIACNLALAVLPLAVKNLPARIGLTVLSVAMAAFFIFKNVTNYFDAPLW